MEQATEGHEFMTSIKSEKEEPIIATENSVNLQFLAAGLIQTAAAITFSKLSADFFRFALTTNPKSGDIAHLATNNFEKSEEKSDTRKTEKMKLQEEMNTSNNVHNSTENITMGTTMCTPFSRLYPNFCNAINCNPFFANALSLVQPFPISQLTSSPIFRKPANLPMYLMSSDSMLYPTFEESDIQTEAHDLSLSKKPDIIYKNPIRQASHNYHSRFKCLFPGCRKAFPFQYHLTNHFRIHTGEKPYKCNHPGCTFAFARQSSLLNHKVVHVERGLRRVFPCVVEGCGKSFLKPTSLSDHMNVHLGKRPYICEEPACGRAFRCRSNLSGHRRVHFREKNQEANIFNNESQKILIPRQN